MNCSWVRCQIIPLLAEEGRREAPGWSVRRERFAGLTTPSAAFGGIHPSSARRGMIWLVLLLILISCSRPQDKTTIQMAVGGQTQFIYLPLTVASQLGFFKDEGLN